MFHYKDSTPQSTINRMRAALADLNLLPIENWYSHKSSLFSVALHFWNTPFVVNGKGITPELALASAYGELLERIQTKALFRYKLDWKPYKVGSKDIYYSADEKFLSYEEIIHNKCPSFWEATGCIPEHFEEEDFRRMAALGPTDRILAIPYFNITTGKEELFPLILVDMLYGTNGLCAGNTPQEALVQGICELAERYCTQLSFEDGARAPQISDACLQEMPEVWKMLQSIKQADVEVQVRDLSHYTALPVVAVLYCDQKSNKYLISPGSHPVLEIAIERCLTELYQGCRELNGINLVACEFSPEKYKSFENIASIYANRRGAWPVSFFNAETIEKIEGYMRGSNPPNTLMAKWCIDTIENRLQKHLLIRSCDMLGTPAFSTIIPGVSELVPKGISWLRVRFTELENRKFLTSLIRNNASEKGNPGTLKFLKDVASSNWHLQVPCGSLSTFALPGPSAAKTIPTGMLCAKLAYMEGDIELAASFARKIVAQNSPIMKDKTCKCTAEFLIALSYGHSHVDITRNMKLVYGETFDFAISFLKQKWLIPKPILEIAWKNEELFSNVYHCILETEAKQIADNHKKAIYDNLLLAKSSPCAKSS